MIKVGQDVIKVPPKKGSRDLMTSREMTSRIPLAKESPWALLQTLRESFKLHVPVQVRVA
jgi:hypothetical protein